jgi:hypothetical protein
MSETPRRFAVCGAFLMPGRENDASDWVRVQPSRLSDRPCGGRSTGASGAARVSGWAWPRRSAPQRRFSETRLRPRRFGRRSRWFRIRGRRLCHFQVPPSRQPGGTTRAVCSRASCRPGAIGTIRRQRVRAVRRTAFEYQSHHQDIVASRRAALVCVRSCCLLGVNTRCLAGGTIRTSASNHPARFPSDLIENAPGV